MADERPGLYLRLDKKIKKKLVAEAVRTGTDQTNLINSILAERYGVEFEKRGHRTVPLGGGSGRRKEETAA